MILLLTTRYPGSNCMLCTRAVTAPHRTKAPKQSKTSKTNSQLNDAAALVASTWHGQVPDLASAWMR